MNHWPMVASSLLPTRHRALGRALIAALALAALAVPARGNSLDSAQKFCAVLDAAGVLAAKCEILSFSSTVALLVQGDAKQAKEFCDVVIKLAGENGLVFDLQWRVRVHSTKSGNAAVAGCRFDKQAGTGKSFGLRPQMEN